MGSIGVHKSYLQAGNFENLDEFDEQTLNDASILPEEYSEPTEPEEEEADEQTIERRAKGAINSANRLLGKPTFRPSDIKRLNQLKQQLNSLDPKYFGGIQNKVDLIMELDEALKP